MNAHSIPPVPPSPYNGYLPVAFPVGGASPTPVIGSAVTGVGGWGGNRGDFGGGVDPSDF